MKRILKSELDKFYTKQEIAKSLIAGIDLSKYGLVLDPCCGDGAFYSNIDHANKIGIDILPHIEGVVQHDFLTWDYSCIQAPSESVLVLSNPPFGKQGSLAMKFINRCCEFADTVAFILPLSFAKQSMKNRIPDCFHLVREEILPPDSFLLDGASYDVKCVFQIWEKRDFKREKISADREVGFSYTKDKSKADISVRRVGVYAGKAFLDTDKSEQSHYFLVFEDKTKLGFLVDRLNSNSWSDLTVGPKSISKLELNEFINSLN